MDKDNNLITPQSPSRSTSSNINLLTQSPNRRKNKIIYSDRYIPNRTGVDLQAAFSLSNEEISSRPQTSHSSVSDIDYRKEEEANRTFNTALKNELFGDNIPLMGAGGGGSSISGSNSKDSLQITPPRSSSNGGNSSNSIGNGLNSDEVLDINSISSTSNSLNSNSILRTPGRTNSNLFSYQSPNKSRPVSTSINNELYSLSPVRQETQRLLLSPSKKPRSISKVPYRVLDAPELVDDFYLNLLDWGSQDILAVGLDSKVYLWNASTGSVEKLCDLGTEDKITSLSWIGAGTHVAVGTNNGSVQIWDAATSKCTRKMTGHNLRVSSLAWNDHILSSGSRDCSILHRDVRQSEHYNTVLKYHKQEVCGLKWNVEENKLASGGNDNKLFVWDGLNTQPLHKFEHNAAIKAISWSPHQRGILASGGGTSDRCIKIWNTLNGNKLNEIDTGSQVCNLIWSINSVELVSTHGYSKNQIMIWKYPQMTQVASLTGHTYRVLYLSLSPDGQTIVTGSGDETLRFWNVFEKNKQDSGPQSVLLDAFMQLR